MNRLIPSPAVRAWLYGIFIALAALAVGYGLLTIEQSGLWLTLVAAVLGLSNTLALANTPTRAGRHAAKPPRGPSM